jgi:hypothetical protein
LIGWRGKLRKEYDSFEDFAAWSEIYALAERLGFRSAEEAWAANPVMQGSVNPSDYRIVKGAP